MKSKPRLLLAILSIAAGGIAFSTSPVVAAKVSFGQKILPLDCIFTTINAGTGELYYVTPAQCGQVVNPPPSPPGTGSKSSTSSSGSGTSSGSQQAVQQFDTNRALFFVPSETSSGGNSTGTGNKEQQPQWQPLATIASQTDDEKQASATTARLKLDAATATGLALGFVLVVAVVALLL